MPTKGEMKKSEILEFITQYYNQYAMSPTVREIADGVHLKSPSSVHTYLKELADAGYIELTQHRARSIQLTWRQGSEDRLVSVPLVGRIAAGVPLFANQYIEETFSIPFAFAKTENTFMLRVHGDSMIDAGILDGDLILVSPDLQVQNGEIIAALVGNETATVKRFFAQTDGMIRLQPENSQMAPMIFSSEDVQIIGKVVGMMRRYD